MSIKPILLLSVLSISLGCKNSADNSHEILTEDNRSLRDLQDKFKYSNLNVFEMDGLDWQTRKGKYNQLDSMTFYMVWQDGERQYSENGYQSVDYLFSWQNRDTNFIEFTIITPYESDYCTNLQYCIFSKEGVAIDKFVVSSSCGDGGWTVDAFGEFIDKHTYELLHIESEMVDEDEIDEKSGQYLYEGDSIVYQFIINTNGQVTKKEISRKHFTAQW